MSIILDALKKSESDQQRQSGPALFEVRVAPPKARFPVWAIAIVALLVINMLIVGYLLLRRGSHADETAANNAAASASGAAPNAAGGAARLGPGGAYNAGAGSGPGASYNPDANSGAGGAYSAGANSGPGGPYNGGSPGGAYNPGAGPGAGYNGGAGYNAGAGSNAGAYPQGSGPPPGGNYNANAAQGAGYGPGGPPTAGAGYNPGAASANGGGYGPGGPAPGASGQPTNGPTLANRVRDAAAAESPPNPDDYAPAAESDSLFKGHVKRGTESGYILYQDAALVPGANLPQLRLDLHVYAAKPEDRFALINMHKMHEGDALADGVQVDSITPDGVVLSHNGSKFLLPRD
jgi:Type II secretion system protein B